jgi:hypothetical protein
MCIHTKSRNNIQSLDFPLSWDCSKPPPVDFVALDNRREDSVNRELLGL